MAENTKIQWATHTFNPWRGCTKVSPGCQMCYAETMSNRNPAVLGIWGPEGTRVLAAEAQWREPIRWNRELAGVSGRANVFCASLADVFEDWPGQMQDSAGRRLWWHPAHPADYPHASPQRPLGGGQDWEPYTLHRVRLRLWDLIRKTPALNWLLLTKRPDQIGNMMPGGPWPNVWLGTSVENEDYRWRLDALQESPQIVPVRFVSYEPALGPLHLTPYFPGINWVIVGGESGGHAREFRLEWARQVVAQCAIADVACFVKQLGHDTTAIDPASRERFPLPLRDAKGGNWDEWPIDLRVRQFPLAV